MRISLIAALDRRGLIGDESGLPWHLPRDLKRFRAYTWGKPLIMGRRTFDLIGKPLPGRLSIVLSRSLELLPPAVRVARTLREGLSIAEEYLATTGGDEVMIIGGGKVYAEAIQRWDRLYLTLVEGQFAGNTYFPVHELLRQSWRPVGEPEAYSADEKNRHAHSFHILERAWEAERPSLQRADPSSARALEELDLSPILRRGTVGS